MKEKENSYKSTGSEHDEQFSESSGKDTVKGGNEQEADLEDDFFETVDDESENHCEDNNKNSDDTDTAQSEGFSSTGENADKSEDSAGDCCAGEAENSKKEAEKDTSDKEKSKSKEKGDERDKKISELEDRVRRNMAEFDNFRKRSEKEKSAMFDIGAKNIAEKILPTIDNFERALKNVPEDKECEAFAEGMDMIYRQLLKDLEDSGVKEIEALGKKFNPDFHNAVMHIEDEEVEENTVVEVFQKGYMYKDSVLRFCMVKVAN